jgi:asparagine synthase (glutamine-hydrolysing)
MCGFFLSLDDASVAIHWLTESIKHRGPDSTKYYIGANVRCGFNRLAIVDSNPLSDQPMLDSSGRYLLLFNGEIYNHHKLRAMLEARYREQFRTRSDTEVLLVGLIHEGADFVSRLDGIFAFAFIDLQSLDVMLGRDLFGVKPLYYYCRGKRLYVSSEIKPLWQLSGNGLRMSNVARFMCYGSVGNGEALVAGLSEVEPNSVKTFHSGQCVRSLKLHNFVFDEYEDANIDEIGDLLYRTIDEQKPEIPYGVLFSGGLDSTLILDRCVCDKNLFGAYSIDVGHPEMSERPWQTYAIETLGVTDKYRCIELDKKSLSLENIAKISSGLDHPMFHPNFVGSFLIARMAADDGLKVLLSGEGADELFLGYRWFFSNQHVSTFLEYVPLTDILAILGGELTQPIDTSGMNRREIFQKIYLQRWLLRQDLTGMANSVEIRVPFLGLDVARFANKLSRTFAQGDGESKWIIKKLLSRRFCKDFIQRKKVGFDFPLNDWIIEDHLHFLRRESRLVDRETLDFVLQKHDRSYMKNRIVFSMVALSMWYESASARLSIQ